MFTTLRAPPEFETNEIYKGDTIELNMFLEEPERMEKVIYDIHNMTLWYFQFYLITDPKSIYQYFGVMDVDVDREPGCTENEFQEKKKEVLGKLIELLDERFPNNYSIFNSGGKGYHIYIYDMEFYRRPDRELNNAERNLWIDEQLKDIFGEGELYNLLDKSVYALNKGVRSYFCRHPKTKALPRLLYVAGQNDDIWYWLWDNIKIGQGKIVPLKNNTVRSAQNRSNRITTTVSSESSLQEELKHLFNSVSDIQLNTLSHVSVVKGTKYCPLKKGEHKAIGKVYIIKQNELSYVLRCHSAGCMNQSISIDLKTPGKSLSQFSYTLDKMFEKGELDTEVKEKKTISKNQKYVLKEDIDWVLSDDGFGIVSSPMGSGKTQGLLSWLEDKQDEYQVLLLVVRQTQAYNFSSVYPNMKCYLETETSLYKKKRCVVCINSLHRIIDLSTGTVPCYDLLILDEMESLLEGLLSTMLSQTNKSKQMLIWKLFKTLILGSKKVLFMDGIFTSRTAYYLQEIGVLRYCKLLENQLKPDYRSYSVFLVDDVFSQELEKDKKENKKIVLVSNLKKVLLHYADLYFNNVEGKTKLVISGDSVKEDKLTSKDPNSYWEQDFFAFNTVVGPGASFDSEHYDVMYLIVSPISCTPQTLYQLINRIRHIKEKRVNILMLYGEKKTVPNILEMKEKKCQNIINFHEKQNNILELNSMDFYKQSEKERTKLVISNNFKVMRELIAKRKIVLKFEDDLFLNMLCRYEIEKMKLNDVNYYCKRFFSMIRKNGGKLNGKFSDPKYRLSEDTLKMMKSVYSNVGKRSRETYEAGTIENQVGYFESRISTLDEEKKKKLRQYISVHDSETQFRWYRFYKALKKEDQDLYQQEFTNVNYQRKAINNVILFSNNLKSDILDLFHLIGLTVEEGIVKGNFTNDELIDVSQEVGVFYEKISDAFYNECKRKPEIKQKKNSFSSIGRTALKRCEYILRHLGISFTTINTKSRKYRRNSENKNERYLIHRLTIDTIGQYARIGLMGVAPYSSFDFFQ